METADNGDNEFIDIKQQFQRFAKSRPRTSSASGRRPRAAKRTNAHEEASRWGRTDPLHQTPIIKKT